jgi:hypothetical protein
MLKSDLLALAGVLMARPAFRRSLRLGMPVEQAVRIALNTESVGEGGQCSEMPRKLVDVHAPTGSNKGKGWRGLKPGINGRHSGSRRHKR